MMEDGYMQKAIPVTTLFLDIGGVLLTNGWDHLNVRGRRQISNWSFRKWRIGIT